MMCFDYVQNSRSTKIAFYVKFDISISTKYFFYLDFYFY